MQSPTFWDCTLVGVLPPGESLKVIGRNADSSWWQVSTPEGLAWIAASVVTANNVDDGIPVVEAPPLPVVQPATEIPPQPTLAPTELPTSTGPTNPTFSDDEVDPSWWPCEQGQIKGNRNSMIYHSPGGSFYAKTYEDVECFNTSAEADAAGYRASKR